MVREGTIARHVGTKYNMLTIIAFSHKLNKGEYFYLCRCDCGTEKLVRLCNLTQQTTRSCGCMQIEWGRQANIGHTRTRKAYGYSAFNTLMKGYQRHAASRNHCWALTEQEFRHLTSQKCFYCETPPANVKSQTNGHGSYIYNGVDRVDNSKGYTIDNCVPSCRPCNSKKNGVTIEMIMKISQFLSLHQGRHLTLQPVY